MKNRDFIIDKPNNLLESVIIIALMTSLRDRGHSSGILLFSFIIDSSWGRSSSIPKYFASSYTPSYSKKTQAQLIQRLCHYIIYISLLKQ